MLNASFRIKAILFVFGPFLRWRYLHSMVLCGIVSNGLQERLSMVTEGYSLGIEFGLVWSSCSQGAAVVFILLFIVVVMDLAGLQTPREDRGLEPLCTNK